MQRLEPLVLDQRLPERAVALNYVHEVIDDATLASHDEIEIAQADVEVDDRDLLPTARESAREARRCRRLAYATLPRGDDDNFGRLRHLRGLCLDRQRFRRMADMLG